MSMSMSDGSRQHVVTVTLTVKAHDKAEADAIVYRRLTQVLQEWFNEITEAPPYRNGSLLLWSVQPK